MRDLARSVPDCIVLFGRLIRDPRTGWRRRLMLVAGFAYLASPIDLIPDFIPVLGVLDDVALAGAMLGWMLRRERALAIELWPGRPEALDSLALRLARSA